MAVVRGAWLEAKGLHRQLWPGLPLCLLAWLGLLGLQQGGELRQPGTALFWPGAEAGLVVAFALIPLFWLAERRGPARRWSLRLSAPPGSGFVAASLALAAYGTALTLLYVLAAFTVYRISGGWAPGAAGYVVVEALLLLLPLAALAPALSALGLPPTLAAVVWLAILALSLLRGFPVPTGSLLIRQSRDLTMTAFGFEVVLSTALATTGGLVLSLALARRQIAKIRHAHRNPG